jgi:2-phospho-L-lactate transferase/gluconeogenesis factor (CofD/UPF0052 family)
MGVWSQDCGHRRRKRSVHDAAGGTKAPYKKFTAIVTVADDGGVPVCSGRTWGCSPWGYSKRMQALANVEAHVGQLLDYRFTEGSLAGQSFGILFLAALTGFSPPSDQAGPG